MSHHDAASRHDRFLQELSEERAAALLRLTRRLQWLIERLHDAREQMPGHSSSARAAAIESYRELRKQALQYRYVEVQREAIGLFRHDVLDEFYRIPPPVE
ncbi:MAG TPA: hypothetical protein VFV95_10115 [Vicinamibacterales bacterium]|nr:hypothetical protein [Vicinamibacterales bacterium]